MDKNPESHSSAFDPDSPGTGDGIFGLPTTPEEAAVVLLPVPWEATVTYGTGAEYGPSAILEASRQVDLFDVETGRPYERGIALLEAGDMGWVHEVQNWSREARSRVNSILEETKGEGAEFPVPDDHPQKETFARVDELSSRVNERLDEVATEWLQKGKLIGLIGGDHSSPLGLLRALGRRYADFGVLQIDAHADLRPAYMGFQWSHASIFHNVLEEIPEVQRLVQVGIRDLGQVEAKRIETDPRIRTFFDAHLQGQLGRGTPWLDICQRIASELPQEVYVSVDIDGLDPALCPNTGTPVPGGLSFAQFTQLLATVVASGRKLIGFDLCEVAPDPTENSDWDGNVGARILYKLIGYVLKSQRD